ncbi:LBF_4227 family protein [Leptospira sp. 'Mane']|uniref:LBF_4227 family protein n=1 Tax=Leptospira sp. 'Mane' TaxID=3387407 RepID=UPI00398B15C2
MANHSNSQEPNTGKGPRKKGGLKGAFHDLLDKLVAYWEVMAVYIQKNVSVFLRNLIFSSIWILSALFFIFISLLYFSYAIFLSLQKFVSSGDPILASLGTGAVFFIIAFVLVELVLKQKK